MAQNDRQAKIAAASKGAPGGGGNTKAILAAVVAVLVIGGIVLAVWLGNRKEETTPALPSGTASSGGSASSGTALVKLPKSVKDATSPVVGSNAGTIKEGVPTLTIFEDFQCPACKQAEELFGGRISELSQAGKLNVVYYVETFLDDRLRNDASARSGNAAMCAADAGRFKEFHDKVFAKQPAHEGDGYSEEVLQGAATEAGISGSALDTFKKCTADKTYMPYLKGIDTYSFKTVGIQGTPTFYANGKLMNLSGVRTADDFEKKLFETAK